jgi:hypothetical protein
MNIYNIDKLGYYSPQTFNCGKIYFHMLIQRNREICFYIHCHLDSYGAVTR